MFNFNMSAEEVNVVLRSIKQSLDKFSEEDSAQESADYKKLQDVMVRIQSEVSHSAGQ